MVGVGEPYRHYHMACPHVELRDYESCYVELFEGNFSSLLYLGFILNVFAVLAFYGGAGAPGRVL